MALRQAFDDLQLAEPIGEASATEEERKKVDDERFKQAKDLVRMLDGLLVDMLIEPQITLEDMDSIPGEDRDMLIAIAQREQHTDALGVRLGVAPLSAFREFRELHGCVDREPEGCEACEALQQRFSTSDLGRV